MMTRYEYRWLNISDYNEFPYVSKIMRRKSYNYNKDKIIDWKSRFLRDQGYDVVTMQRTTD